MMRRRFMNSSNRVPLSFEALEDGLSISFSSEILYCINGGAWETLLARENTEEVNKGSVISFRHAKSIMGLGNVGLFSINKKCNVSGACSSIIPKVLGEKYMAPRLFRELFYYCDTIVDASKLELPTTLADFCYERMFIGCSSLTTAPELPATTLTKGCYQDMFRYCSKLNYIKMLATNISADSCLNYWVSGVASTGTFVKNPAMTTLPTGTSGIPSGWTVINDGEESEGGGGSEGPITFVVEDYNGELNEYTIPYQMTWGEFIDSEYNKSLYDSWAGKYFKEFVRKTSEAEGVTYVQYRQSVDDCSAHSMLHVGDWEYIYPDELIEPKQYTNN